MRFSKYFSVTKVHLAEYFAYRLNFVLWRIRVVLSILITYFLWQSVYLSKADAFGYKESHMLSYVLMLIFIQSLVLSTQASKVAEEIIFGNLSNFLLKPASYIVYNFFRDLSDKIVNTVFSVFEIAILIFLLKPSIYLPGEPGTVLLFFLALAVAGGIYFLISILISFIGFWSTEAWSPRFVFYILVVFLSGGYFPLDILPDALYQMLMLLPFGYIIFFPLKIYLGQNSAFFLIKGFLISGVWLLLLSLISFLIWRKGIRYYTAAGR